MRNRLTTLTVLVLFSQLVFSQNLPLEMKLSADGRMLYTGWQAPVGLYDYSIVRDVYLNFSQPDYWQQLTSNYTSETNIAANMLIDNSTFQNVGVRFRGNTSYMTIQQSQKKSFSVEADFMVSDQSVMGYTNLKFNNAHQDPSFMREVLYDRMAKKYTPIAKANFIHLFLNNQNWGVYCNVQSVDKTFLEEWFLSNNGARFRATTSTNNGPPQWGDGTAALNYLSPPDSSTYDNYYTLQSTDISNSWQKLIDACYALNQSSPSNYATLKNYIDIDKSLWFLACENIFTDDDSYVMKGKMDYKVYYEPETGRTTPLEYDGNSTFEAASNNWSPFKNATNINYPLLNKLLNIPEFRQRYLAHYRTILNETFTTANANALIDELDIQIGALVASDPKKLYSTAAYTSEVAALKTIVANRRNYILTNAEILQQGPVITEAPYYNSLGVQYEIPVANESVTIKTNVTSSNGIFKVNLYYDNGLIGNFNVTEMFDDGAHQDGTAGDGIFGGTIPGQLAGSWVRYYIEAIANNPQKSATYLPAGAEHDVFIYKVKVLQAESSVVINEIMAQNTLTVTDESGGYADWVELYNNSNNPVDISGYFLSDDTMDFTCWSFPPNTVIPANGYLIVWADVDTLDGALHSNFNLSSNGEVVTLSDQEGNTINQVIYGPQNTDMGYARVPNGTGNFVIQQPTFFANNEPLSTNDESSDFAWVVYPVPASTTLNINISSSMEGKYMQLFDAKGSLISTHLIQAVMMINVEQIPSGVYYLKCGNTIRKFVK
jgi:hypothetical protein